MLSPAGCGKSHDAFQSPLPSFIMIKIVTFYWLTVLLRSFPLNVLKSRNFTKILKVGTTFTFVVAHKLVTYYNADDTQDTS